MVALTDAIAKRTGVGDLLAEGPALAAAKLGHPEIAMAVKGQAVPAYDPRGLKGMGLGYATSNRGACHLRAYVAAAELGVVAIESDPLSWQGKGELVKTFQDLHAFSDSLDLCKFSAFAQGAQEYASQYAVARGEAFSPEDVMLAGERIYNLERYYNNLAGFREGSDTLPDRFTKEAVDDGRFDGPRLRTRPDARRVLRSARLAGRGRAGEEAAASSRFPEADARARSRRASAMQVSFHATLRPIVGGKIVEVPFAAGGTVRDLMVAMVDRWPELAEHVYDEDGRLSRRVAIFVDGRNARWLEGEETGIEPGQKVAIFPPVAGG